MTTNLNPLAIDLPETLATAFDNCVDHIGQLALSTAALTAAAAEAGITLAHFTSPTKDSTPEHRFSYATLQRLAVGKQAALLGVQIAAFGPIFNDAVKSTQSVEIGDQTKTKKAWRSALSNLLRPVKDNWTKAIRAELDAAELLAKCAAAELDKAATLDARANETLEAADRAAKAVKTKAAEIAAKAAEATGKAKARLEAQHAAALVMLEQQEATVTAHDTEATKTALAVIERREVLDEVKAEAAAIAAQLPKTRGTKTRTSIAEKAAAQITTLIAQLQKCDENEAGADIDLPQALHHLTEARKALKA